MFSLLGHKDAVHRHVDEAVYDVFKTVAVGTQIKHLPHDVFCLFGSLIYQAVKASRLLIIAMHELEHRVF